MNMIKVLNVPSLYSALYKVVDFCKENEKVEIVVPDKLSLFMEKFLFEKMNINASFNIKVSTLNRFAKKSCIVDKDKQISKVGSILLIHRILNENIDKLEVLKSKAYSFSYAEDVFRTLGQFKASRISYEEMKDHGSDNIQLNNKIKDLAIVYEEYENQKAGLLDASDMFLMSTLTVAKGKENSKLLFIGFDDFTAVEYAIIERLASVAEVNILNNFSKANNRHIYNNEIMSQLRDIAHINELPFLVEDCEIKGSELKQFLQNNIYSLKKENFILKQDIVKLFSGNGVASEIEFIARDIRNKILSGERYDNFGVAIYGLDNYSNTIKEIFEKYEINYYLDSEISLTKSILFKFFLSVLKYNLDGYSLSNLIDIINSPFCRILKEDKYQIIQKLVSLNFRGKLTNNLDLNIDEETNEYLINFMNNLTFDSKIDAVSLVERLKNFDKVFDFDLILTFIRHEVNNILLIKKSKEVIFSLFDDILKFNNCIDVESFYDIFAHVASVVKINNLPLSLDAVKVVDANNTMEIFQDLYIVNATHENAPSLKNDCGIILDNEIEKLSFTHKLAPTIAHINRLSKLRLYNTLTLFENELVLTYSNSQSEIIKELQNKLQVKSEVGIINIEPITSFDYDKYIVMSKWDYIEYLTKYDKNNIKIDEKLIKNKEFNKISNKNLKIYNELNIISATNLENYFKCPFYEFLTNTMKIKPRLETEILSLDIGNVLHEIMYKYYKLNKKVDDIYIFCKDEVFKLVERDERLKLNSSSPILINLIDEAVRVVNALNYIDDNSLFKPKYFEKGFNNETALRLKNIHVMGKVDRIDIHEDMVRIIDYKSGKADASLKELYYGNKLQLFLYACAMENVLKKNVVGTFYLPLHNAYVSELSNNYSLKGFYLAEDFVVHAFDKRLEAGKKSDIVNVRLSTKNAVCRTVGYKELDMTALNNLKEYSKKVSEQAVEEIKSGYIKPTPSIVSKHCDYCPYNHVCMRKSNDINYRSANKVNLESFKEVSND